MSTEKIVINGGIIVTMDPRNTVIVDGSMVLSDGKICEIQNKPQKNEVSEKTMVIEAHEKVILPGFINSHMHQRPMRGIGDGHKLKTWHTYADTVSDHMTSDEAYIGALCGFGEALKAGVTTVVAFTTYPESEARAASDLGIRARLVPHILHEEEVEQYYKLLLQQSGTENNLVRYWVGLEIATICDSTVRRRARQIANELGLRIHTHFSEDHREDIDTLIEDGFLGADVHLAHCVHLSSEDISKLAEYKVGVSHCPTSNMKLVSGVAPVITMRAQDIPVGIASDGVLLTGRIDLFEQMRIAALTQRNFHSNPGVLLANELLSMVTQEAACAIGMDHLVGSLEVGKKADITILDSKKLWLSPLIHDDKVSNLLQLVVWSGTATDVDMVLVDGKVVVEQGRLNGFDEGNIVAEVERFGKRLMSEISIR